MEIGMASCRWIGWKADVDVAADAEVDVDEDGIDHMLVTWMKINGIIRSYSSCWTYRSGSGSGSGSG